MKTLPIDRILSELRERLLECPEDHHRALAAHLVLCIDYRAIPAQMSEDMSDHVHVLYKVIDTGKAVGCEPMRAIIATRLASTAYALLTSEANVPTATILLDTARLVAGLPGAQAGNEGTTRTIADLRREVTSNTTCIADLRREVNNRAASVDNLMEANARHLRDIAEKDAAIKRAEDTVDALRKMRSDLAAENDRWREWAMDLAGIDHDRNPADKDIRLAVDAVLNGHDRTPEQRLTWVARFNNGNGGASITLDGRTTFVSGQRADDLADALCGWRAVRDSYKADLEKVKVDRDSMRSAVDALTADLKRARDELDEALDCARREVVWVPKRVPVTDLRGIAPMVSTPDNAPALIERARRPWRKPCGGCEGTGQTYGSGGGPPCPDCNGAGFTPAP